MGTSLTGLEIKDTYDGLVKTTDNGPLSGTLKALSDGLGNDSTLSLSTTAASIAGTLAVTGNATFDTNTLFVDAANNRVGIGITTPDSKVRIQNDNATVPSLTIRDGGTPTVDHIRVSSGTYGDAFFVTAVGNVGIGTSSPARLLTLKNNAGATNGISFQSLATTSEIAAIECNQTLDTIDFEMVSNFAGNGFRFLTGTTLVERARFTANGLTFNGDTAAANALDDYEEGTWTPVDSSGGGLTFLQAVGTYTKIGREVFVRGFIQYPTTANVSAVILGGLPFTTTGGLAGRGGNVTYVDKTTMSYLITNTAATTMSAFNSAGVATTNANLSDAYLYFSANYNV